MEPNGVQQVYGKFWAGETVGIVDLGGELQVVLEVVESLRPNTRGANGGAEYRT